MPTVTRIEPQRRRENRRNVYIDGEFAFGLNLNVVARFRLREGMTIDDSLRQEIETGEVRQEAFDHAIRLIGQRMQGERELRQKLGRKEYGPGIIDAVVEECRRLGYVDDARYAAARVSDAVRLKGHGRSRAVQELVAKGIDRVIAERAADEAYADVDPVEAALAFAEKKRASLSRLDRATAVRRLSGFLQRRGYDYETVSRVVERVLPRE
jgi:regulatory protein